MGNLLLTSISVKEKTHEVGEILTGVEVSGGNVWGKNLKKNTKNFGKSVCI
jgi:hypothetical protein